MLRPSLLILPFAAVLTSAPSLPAREGVQLAFGDRAMVVAGHPEAAAAGVSALRKGGNAIDAATAVSLALGVAEPYGSGLGGKLELVYFERSTGTVHVIDGMDATGDSFDPEAFRRLPAERRRAGGGAVAIPGLPAALIHAHETWGRLPRSDVFAPAIHLARGGFEVLPGTRRLFAAQLAKLQANPDLARVYLPDGTLPNAGTRLVNEDLAVTLEAIAEHGASGFYAGFVGSAIARAVTEDGGWLTLADLSAYSPIRREPVRVELGAYSIVGGSAPANGTTTAALALKILESREWQPGGFRDASNIDAFLRAFQQANIAVREQLADTDDASAVAARLLSPRMIDLLREAAARAVPDAPRTRRAEAALWFPAGDELEAADTTHFCVIDAEGNAVSATQSLSLHFGSGILVRGTGVILNNTLSNFATTGGPNLAARNKRPRSTIAPTLVLRDGRLHAVIGLPGAGRIPTAMTQVLADHLLLQRDLAAAIASPRVHPDMPVTSSAPLNEVWLEDAPAEALSAALSRLGWIPVSRADTESFGGFTAIEVTAGGELRGIADLRRTNAAVGY